MKIAALLPMKGNSVRVPGKNLRPLQGKTLFHWILGELLKVPGLDEIVVESDSEEIIDSARSVGQVTILHRPPELCGDEVPMNSLIEFHMSEVSADFYLQTHATNPLLRAETIGAAIDAFHEGRTQGHDSLFSVTELRTRLFDKDAQAINHDPQELIPTQNLPPVFEENSNIYLFSKASFAARTHRIGNKPMMFSVPRHEAVDIDEEEDFQFADFLMERRLKENP